MNEHRAGNTAVSITVLGLVLFFTSCAANQEMPADASPAGLFHLETAQWSEPYDGPLGFPKGAQRASLGTDPASGGETYYAKFPAGSRFQLHWHAHAEYAVVLRGKVTHLLGSERQPLNVGDYVIIPPKQPHGWEADANEDAFLLIRRDGPADFNFVK